MTSTPHPTEDGFQPYTRAERLLNLLMALLGSRVGLNREQIRSVVRGYDPASSPEAFERMFERDVADSRPVTLASWRERPWPGRLAERAALMFERLW